MNITSPVRALHIHLPLETVSPQDRLEALQTKVLKVFASIREIIERVAYPPKTLSATPMELTPVLPLYHFLSVFKKVWSERMPGKEPASAMEKCLKELYQLIYQHNASLSTYLVFLSHFRGEVSLLSALSDALKFLRAMGCFEQELQLYEMFVHFVLQVSNPDIAWVDFAILAEKDLVRYFCALSHQQAYSRHLESLLLLQGCYLGHPSQPAPSLNHLYVDVIERLSCYIAESHQAEYVIQGHYVVAAEMLAFLKTQPEWMFHADRPFARFMLQQVFQNPIDPDWKQRVELEIFFVDAAQRFRSPFISHADLVSLLKRIVAFLPKVSANQKIKLLEIGTELYERLALEQECPAGTLGKLIASIDQGVKIGKESLGLLLPAARLAYSRLLFLQAFYSVFFASSSGKLQGVKTALMSLAQAVEIESNVKGAAGRLLECLAHFDGDFKGFGEAISRDAFRLMVQFKYYLKGDIVSCNQHDLMYPFGGKPGKLEASEDAEEGAKLRFLNALKNQDYRFAQDCLTKICLLYRQRALAVRKGFSDRFINVCSIEEKKDCLDVSLGFNVEEIRRFLEESVSVPLMDQLFPIFEIECLSKENVFGMHLTFDRTGTTFETSDIFSRTSAIQDFSVKFAIMRKIMKSYEGVLSFAPVIDNMMYIYLDRIWVNGLFRSMRDRSLEKSDKETKQQIRRFRHHGPTFLSFIKLMVAGYDYLDHITSYPGGKQFDFALQAAILCVCNGMLIAGTNQDKMFWHGELCRIYGKQHLRVLAHESAHPVDVENAYLDYLYAVTAKVVHARDLNSAPDDYNELINNLPETFQELHRYILPSGRKLLSREILQKVCSVILFKALDLIFHQKVRAGDAMYEECMKTYFPKLSGSDVFKTSTIFSFNLAEHSKLVNPAEMKWDIYGNSKEFSKAFARNRREFNREMARHLKQEAEKATVAKASESASDTVEEEYEDFFELKNEKNTVVQEAIEKLRKQALKKEKKLQRPMNPNAQQVTAKIQQISAPPECIEKRLIDKTAAEIFNAFWVENPTSPQGPWEMRSFRNDVKIKRCQALQLIVALGGSYSKQRGHGSHHVAHLPRITFNGQDVGGLVDFQTHERMITLTNDQELKYYQIIQLRNILIEQGFTPDTVKTNRG